MIPAHTGLCRTAQDRAQKRWDVRRSGQDIMIARQRFYKMIDSARMTGAVSDNLDDEFRGV